MRRATDRRGMTLLEVLVAVGILIVLAAMFLPAIQRARAEARVTECADWMRQLGIAVYQYDRQCASMPNPQWNVWRAVSPWVGASGMVPLPDSSVYAWSNVSRAFRCPSDRFLAQDDLENALSYAPVVDSAYLDGDNDGKPDGNRDYCAWSCLDRLDTGGARGGQWAPWKVRTAEGLPNDTVLLVEYWHPANRILVEKETPAGYLFHDASGTNESGTIDYIGAPAAAQVGKGSDIGGYTFLSGFADEAVKSNRPRSLAGMFHNGRMNLAFADGHVEARRLTEITNKAPKDIPIWTRAAD